MQVHSERGRYACFILVWQHIHPTIAWQVHMLIMELADAGEMFEVNRMPLYSTSDLAPFSSRFTHFIRNTC